MKQISLFILTIIVMVGCKCTSSDRNPTFDEVGMTADEIIAEKVKEQRNKENVLEFFQLLIGDHDYESAEKYMGKYIQHDPKVNGSGMAPLKEYLTISPKFKNRPKGIKIQLAQVMTDGNFVYVQNRKELSGKKMMIQHVFRLSEDSKIEEHWTTVTSVNVNEGVNPQPLY